MKNSSDSTQHYVARIAEAQILDDNNNSNHVEVDGVNRIYHRIEDTRLNQ